MLAGFLHPEDCSPDVALEPHQSNIALAIAPTPNPWLASCFALLPFWCHQIQPLLPRVQSELVSKALLVFLKDVPIESCCDQKTGQNVGKDWKGRWLSKRLRKEDLWKSGVILQKLMLGGSATKAKMRLELDAEWCWEWCWCNGKLGNMCPRFSFLCLWKSFPRRNSAILETTAIFGTKLLSVCPCHHPHNTVKYNLPGTCQ